MENAAYVALSGQDPLAYLNEQDPFTRAMMQRLAERHLEITKDLQDELSHKIVNTLGKSMSKRKG